MADRVILTIGTKKGVFVADAAKPRRRFELRGPFGPRRPCVLDADRCARDSAPICFEL